MLMGQMERYFLIGLGERDIGSLFGGCLEVSLTQIEYCWAFRKVIRSKKNWARQVIVKNVPVFFTKEWRRLKLTITMHPKYFTYARVG